jgi:hypothetical protein
MTLRNAEQYEILGIYLDLLAQATGDGAAKRAAGTKPLWKDDPDHLAAAYRHLDPSRERYDKDSGAHKYVHGAWRLLGVAWQDMRADGLIVPDHRIVLNTDGPPVSVSEDGTITRRVTYQNTLFPEPMPTSGPRPGQRLSPHHPDFDWGDTMLAVPPGALVREPGTVNHQYPS